MLSLRAVVWPQKERPLMIDRYFSRPETRTHLQNGPIGSALPAFIAALEERGHAVSSIRRMVGTADRLGRWIQDRGVQLQKASQGHIDLYLVQQGRRPDSRRKNGHLPQRARFLKTITAVLRQQGLINGPEEATDVAQWADRFSRYLIQVRGASRFTKDNYVRYARRLMLEMKSTGTLDWVALNGSLICSFVQREASKLNRGSCAQPVTAVRCFLRFLEAEGQVRPNLARAIPMVRQMILIGMRGWCIFARESRGGSGNCRCPMRSVS
jgi:hypothetical protein